MEFTWACSAELGGLIFIACPAFLTNPFCICDLNSAYLCYVLSSLTSEDMQFSNGPTLAAVRVVANSKGTSVR